MIVTHHPTVKQIIYLVLFVVIPASVAICYFLMAEGNYAEELFISFLVFLGSCGLCLFLYFSDAEEISFCEKYEVSEETFNDITNDSASVSNCGGDSGGGDV